MREGIKEWTKTILTAAIVAFIVIQFVLPTMVYGISMEPTFESNDYLLINRQAYRGERTPQRGDVIVFESKSKDEEGENKKLIKRVIAVAGDIVSVMDGKVYINGMELNDAYTKDGLTDGEVYPVEVPEGSVFVLGDNRLHSTDSRYLAVGFVKEETIVGQVFLRIYPFNKFGLIGSSY